MSAIVIFRADATAMTGGGHIMRCLALADRLNAAGATCAFFVNEEAPKIVPALAASDHLVASVAGVDDTMAQARFAAPAGAALMIADHYGISAAEETAFRAIARKIVVIDDLADKPHDCDLLLNQNINATSAAYSALVSPQCRLLLGPRHALLRPEFAASRLVSLDKRRRWDGRVRRVLLFLGLTDVGGFTAPLAEILLSAMPDLDHLDVVLGVNAPSRAGIERIAGTDARVELTVSSHDMAGKMLAADVAVGAVGSTSWERAVLGLPTLGLVLADNQAPVAEALAAAGALILLGDVRTTPLDLIGERLRFAAHDAASIREAGVCASRICDGAGVDRVARQIERFVIG